MAATRIATASIPFDVVSVEERSDQLRRVLRAAGEGGAELCVLPEYLAYHRTQEGIAAQDSGENFGAWAEAVPGGRLLYEMMASAAREYGMTVIYGALEQADEDHYYNAAPVIGPDGALLGVHRKAILNANEAEDPEILPGEDLAVIETPHGRAGIILCYEIYFPEITRIYELHGADFFVYLHADNDPRTEAIAKTRCYDSYIPMICSCYQRCGAAWVLDARGVPVAPVDAATAEGMILVEADLRERPSGGYFWDDDRQIDLRAMRWYQRRPELFRTILDPIRAEHPLGE